MFVCIICACLKVPDIECGACHSTFLYAAKQTFGVLLLVAPLLPILNTGTICVTGALPCQGSFVLTPGTAAIPRELSLSPHPNSGAASISRELSLNPQSVLGTAATPRPGHASDAGTPSIPNRKAEIIHSPAVFEFAPNPVAAHVRTAKLNQPNLQPHAANLPRGRAGAPNASLQGRAVTKSPEGGPIRNPRTSMEDLSQMQSCLNQLEQQLVQMPRLASRGQASRPQTADSATRAQHTDRQTPSCMHLQLPGTAPSGQTNTLHISEDAKASLPPALQQDSRQNERPEARVAQPDKSAEEEDRGSRPSSTGSAAQQPEFAVLKARMNARRQGDS